MYLEILCCPWRAVAVTSNRWEQRFDSASAGPEAGLPGIEFQGRRRREVSRRALSGSGRAKCETLERFWRRGEGWVRRADCGGCSLGPGEASDAYFKWNGKG